MTNTARYLSVPLTPKQELCSLCQAKPAPFVPVVVLPNGESFTLPLTLCARCLLSAKREAILTPEIRTQAVDKLFRVYGLSPIINPDTWKLRYIEEETYHVDRVSHGSKHDLESG